MKLPLLSFFVLLAFSLNAEESLGQSKDPVKLLSQVREGLQTFQAEFIQYELTPDNQQVDENNGTVWMRSPDLFKWQYRTPIEQLIIADGKQVWVYDEDLEQVTVKEQNNQLNPIYVIINDELSQKHYDIKYLTTEQNIDWVSLTPKEASEDVKYVWLAIQNNSITKIKVFNQFDQIMVFEFSHLAINPELPADLFEFIPPEGVDVIRAIGD